MKASPNILVVEHDPSIREFIVSALMDEGFHAFMAPSPRKALAELNETRPCLLLIDMNNVSVDDLNLVSEYRNLVGSEASVAVMSTASHIQSLGNCVQADALLSKPFNLNDLFDIVARCGQIGRLSPTA
jgi:DNA-binding NtrC family response regulator